MVIRLSYNYINAICLDSDGYLLMICTSTSQRSHRKADTSTTAAAVAIPTNFPLDVTADDDKAVTRRILLNEMIKV